jgi:NADH-quinone oxidoreductase subunit M
MMLWTFVISFFGALAAAALPSRAAHLAKWVALVASVAGLLVAAAGCVVFSFVPEPWQFEVRAPWIPAAGIGIHLGADGISMVMLLLTGLVAVAGILFSWNITHRPRAFFAFYLLVVGGAYGVFQSFDLFLLLVFYELVIVPKYFLIAIWGSTNREYGAMKLTIYSVVGGALVLLGILALGAASGAGTFDVFALREAAFAPAFQVWVFPVLFLGFGILAGLWPFHTWAPTGHVAAPTAASMLLAGLVMKLGSYGALRVAMPLLPEGLEVWRMAIVVLAGTGIVYGAFVALAQKDLKFVIGYSSVSHMGFVLLGLMTLNLTGVGGAVLQMFSHGVIAALLFAVVGRMVYDRTHTRDLGALGAMDLGRAMPFAAGVFVAASAASMGLPGFSGFIAEISILIGAWQAFPWLVAVGVGGILLTGAFSLRALQKAFFERRGGDVPAGGEPMPPVTPPEIAGSALLLTAMVVVGLWPQPVIALIHRGLQTPFFERLLQ